MYPIYSLKPKLTIKGELILSSSNSDRNKRGNSLKQVLAYMLELCKQLDYIKDYQKDYQLGMPNFTDKNQFKASYHIQFQDNTEWIIYTTTSLRDRIKEQYWDAYNLKNLNHNITKAYLVYPDNLEEKEKIKFISKDLKIQNGGEFSSLEALVSQDSFFNRIEAYALQGLTANQQRDLKGNNFEKRIASTLSNPCNLLKWKTQDPMLEGLHYHIFEKIISSFDVDSTQVESITSTSDKSIIGLLPSGGPVKTDVLTTITYSNGSTEHFTISCKRSSNSSVSVHQYPADTFADVLDSNNAELRRTLNEFQSKGNIRDMNDKDKIILERELRPHIEALCKWAIGGIGGDGDPSTQWANYLLVYDNNTENFSLHTTEDFCLNLSQDCSRTFNTPFSWTYQGTRGTNIQLKCPLH